MRYDVAEEVGLWVQWLPGSCNAILSKISQGSKCLNSQFVSVGSSQFVTRQSFIEKAFS